MNILLLGSGGREHALAWKLASSGLTDRLICAPGNAGMAREAECMALDLTDHAAVIALCKTNKIDFVVVGPEGPLVAGVADDLEAAGFRTFGPMKSAAQLEGSKGFTKDLCRANNIPTAAYERFTSAEPAKAYARKQGMINAGLKEPPRILPVKNVPPHHAQVYLADQGDIAEIFGDPSRTGNFTIGYTREQNHPVCIDLEKFVQRSSGVFGATGTGKSFLTRIVLAGLINYNKASVLVLDMCSKRLRLTWPRRSPTSLPLISSASGLRRNCVKASSAFH